MMLWENYCGCNNNISTCIFNITVVSDGDITPCLQLLLQGSASLLLFFFSICYFFNFIGYRHDRVSSTSALNYITLMRCWLCVFLACSSLAQGLIGTNEIRGSSEFGRVLYFLVVFLTAIAWIMLGVMFYTARYRFPLHKRGPIIVILVYFINLAVFGKGFQAYWMSPIVSDYRSTIILLYSVGAVSHVFLISALIPSGIEYSTDNQGVSIQTTSREGEESASLVTGTNNVSYRTFGADGVIHRGETGNILSKLIFWWVQPLMKRGRIGLIQQADDVFHVSFCCSQYF